MVDWLKPLARQAHQECGDRGVGVIGMCITGGFALSTAVELPDKAANLQGLKAQGRPPHSVLTTDLIDAAGQPTREAVSDIIAFFQHALRPW